MTLFDHFCIPQARDYIDQTTYEAFKDAFWSSSIVDTTATFMNDVAGGWPVYIVCTIISLIIGYFYLLFIRIFGGFILVMSWLQIMTAFLCGGFYTYYFARE